MPSHLNGLNIIHPAQPQVDPQDLLSGPAFPDLSAQLALWTNLPFESEESPVLSRDEKLKSTIEESGEEKGGTAPHESHVNVVTGTSSGNLDQRTSQSPTVQQQQPTFDFNQLLAGFNLDALQHQQQSQVPHSASAVSLAQLLALHSLTQGTPMYAPSLPHSQSIQPAPAAQIHSQQSPATASSGSPRHDPSSIREISPPVKRSRARKSSVSTTDSSISPIDSGAAALAAEDKRRRNTAASARFRLKKKEREFALENKAKELELRVSELERECEGLRRENGWLKGLVIGVTGAAQNNATSAPQQAQSPPVLAGMRRPRESE
ncbi:hypothetical protein Moror_16484 [Moniliophthora roreri MCA 2997]|uniref:BZIP domain-containing protein n=2 Tax=Moniliophthora roreri TaxID=221103 RepID=V2XDD7_MONRO|nr:hypothetical protein Moror_16484 [Moniliophthora roreri MCA 2997]